MGSLGRDHIGPYRLLKLIQVGTATQIWEAINSTDHRRWAIKILRDDRLSEKSEVAGMRHEFDVCQSLDHPCVIRMLELGEFRRLPYLVIEFFPAPNLKQCLRQCPDRLTSYLAGTIVQAAWGIGHMHERGWVHRDVKPENILLNESGQVKLVDFAIAQRLRKGLGRLFSGKIPVQGTRSYMAPEQIRGEPTDARSDIYSLGCTIFHLVSGRVPYTGASADELLMRHLKGAVPTMAAFQPDVTPEFNQLVASLMAKRPENRPQSIPAFLAALEPLRLFKSDRQPVGDQARSLVS